MIIKKSKVFRYCSYGYLVLWTFIFIAVICSRIVDIETSKEKIIFSIVMSVILIPIVLCSLHYSLFYLKVEDNYLIRRNLFGITKKYVLCDTYYTIVFPYRFFKNNEYYFRVFYKNKKITNVYRYDTNFDSFGKKIKVVMKKK